MKVTQEMIEAFEKASGRAVGRDSLAGIEAVLATLATPDHLFFSEGKKAAHGVSCPSRWHNVERDDMPGPCPSCGEAE